MIQDMLSSTLAFALLKWTILVVIWLCLALGLQRDKLTVKKFHDSSISASLLRILHRRNVHIFILTSMLMVVLLGNDVRDVQNQMAELSPAPAEEQPPAAAIPHDQPMAPKADSGKFAVPANNTAIPYSDITEFKEANGKQQAYIDFLKERYETWLITYYYLHKCNQVNESDLEVIMGSLRKSLGNAHADSSVERNILLAASGSYKELYSEIPCDEAHVTGTKAGYEASMTKILHADTQAAPATTPAPAAATPAPAAAAQPVPAAQPAANAPETAVTPVQESTLPPATATPAPAAATPAPAAAAPASAASAPAAPATSAKTDAAPQPEKPQLTK